MGTILVYVFLALFALAIGQAVVRHIQNPYAEVAFAELPAALRTEVERILPGYEVRKTRLTKKRDDARIEGEYRGERFRVEGELDAAGELVELELDGVGPKRKTGMAGRGDLPEPVLREMERVLGGSSERLDRSVITRGDVGGEPYFEIEGWSGEWKWEIAVSASGRLLEVEREKRGRR